jgi:hypothetical protein
MTFTASRPFKAVAGPSGFYKVYDTVAADVDLLAEGPQPANTPPWKIIVWGGGTLVVQRPDGETVTFSDLPVGALLEEVEAIALLDTSTATDIAVFW